MKHQLLSLVLILAGVIGPGTATAAHHKTPPLADCTLDSYVGQNPNFYTQYTAFSSRQPLMLADGDIGASKAAKIAKSAYGGTVMGVKRSGNVYQVKLMQNGRVRIVKVNASTGQIMGG